MNKVDCDEEILLHLRNDWNKLSSNLKSLDIVRLSCCYNVSSNTDKLQLTGFCDDSLMAYSIFIYIKEITADREIIVNFVIAK